ncbi:efflux transporter outer membrane subunit [Kalamiella sp. sgz302252]|uniref:efflux transporter outer membrane subunit n=1 Tax=Pantoea sp. sgz302252 TaxID=3341827 RepID=UPI0036D25D19
MNRLLLVTLLAVWLTGCGSLVKSDYQRPEIVIPASWRMEASGVGYLKQSGRWWENFADPQLSALIDQALSVNNDLAVAGLQLQQARLAAGLANTNLTPDVTLSGSGSQQKNLRRQSTTTDTYSASLSLSYELDLWGKLARAREKAQWQAEASLQDRHSAALTLIGETAQYYWKIGNLNQKIALQQRAIAVGSQTRDLVKSRYQAGATNESELLQAEQSLLTLNNTLHSLQQQREEARNALAILFNQPPTERQPELASLDVSQEVPIAITLPVAVIARRPDVRAAEASLRASLAGADVERLNFYPSLSLTAALSAGSTVFQQWFSNPVRALGSAVTLPFVQWNQMRLTAKSAELDVEQAVIAFRSTVYAALAEVDNTMTQRLDYLHQKQQLAKNLRLSQRRLTLTTSQYRAGAVSLETLLDAEDALLSVETSLSDMQYNYLYATLKLWLALGGGTEENTQGTAYE